MVLLPLLSLLALLAMLGLGYMIGKGFKPVHSQVARVDAPTPKPIERLPLPVTAPVTTQTPAMTNNVRPAERIAETAPATKQAILAEGPVVKVADTRPRSMFSEAAASSQPASRSVDEVIAAIDGARAAVGVSATMPSATAPVDVASVASVPASQPATQTAVVAFPEPPLNKRPVLFLTTPPKLSPRSPQQLDLEIDKAIRETANLLIRKIDDHSKNQARGAADINTGEISLAIFAVLAASQAIDDPELKREKVGPLLQYLKKRTAVMGTYDLAIRACALSLYNRDEDRKMLEKYVRSLIALSDAGSYDYGNSLDQIDWSMTGEVKLASFNAFHPASIVWDNSNSQFGVLGVWAGAEVGVQVPQAYWKNVNGHWTFTQKSDGGWVYRQEPLKSLFTMTCAGVASAMICYDYLYAKQLVDQFQDVPVPRALLRSLAVLEADVDRNLDSYLEPKTRSFAEDNMKVYGYLLFGLERVALANGFKYFGKQDWYRRMADRLLDTRSSIGMWGPGQGDLANTSFCLICLARGRHPLVANKLRYDGPWCNRPRDLANVARYVGGIAERPIGWQVVSFTHPGADWSDAPILYISGNKALNFTGEQSASIKEYVDWGGMLLFNPDGGSAAFKQSAEQLVARIWPNYKVFDVPQDHALYNIFFKMQAAGMPLRAVSNGTRVIALISQDDHAGAWQGRAEKEKPRDFEFIQNVFMYATGRSKLRNRLDTPYIERVPAAATATWFVARVRYEGNWDPEPIAWIRFGRQMHLETGVSIKTDVTAAAALDVKTNKAAHLTGTDAIRLNETDLQGLRRYVQAGGVLVIDAAGGHTTFVDSIEKEVLPSAFPGMVLSPADPKLPPIGKTQAVTDDLSQRQLRAFTVGRIDPRARPIMTGQFGKGWVIYSPLDVTTGMLGTNVWGVLGHTPDYSKSVMKNIVVWSHLMRGTRR